MKKHIILQHNNAQPHMAYLVGGNSRYSCEVLSILDLLLPPPSRPWKSMRSQQYKNNVSIQEVVHTWLKNAQMGIYHSNMFKLIQIWQKFGEL
jgi:hypothetical protein